MPSGFLGFITPDSKQWLDLPAWCEAHGWDKNGALGDMQVDFDPDPPGTDYEQQPAVPKGECVRSY
jgi:hypothetical protein